LFCAVFAIIPHEPQTAPNGGAAHLIPIPDCAFVVRLWRESPSCRTAVILGVSGPARRLGGGHQGASAMTATTWPRTPGYDDVVDLNRYPIGDPASPAYRELVRVCRDQLRGQGVAQLAGFLTPAAVSQMLALASQLAAHAWASDQAHTAYFEPADDSAGPDHPRALLQHSAKKAVAYDQIPAGAPIRRLYESDDLTAFIAGVLGSPCCTAAPTRWTPWRSRSSATVMSSAGISTTASSPSP
jgi:hypothetical protein